MSTRSNIELYTCWESEHRSSLHKRSIQKRKDAVLYHHHDGYPTWMGPELERILSQVKEELAKVGYPYWWDGDRVGALMVKLSADDTEYYKSVPRFQPCLELHVDIEYLWRVFLGPKAGQYEIYCYEISQDWNGGGFESLKSVNWRAAVKEAKKRTPNEGV